tara:strand:- start:995 stop:1108 length:114 start_codon:yes stop_codon:yes gene_type:complete
MKLKNIYFYLTRKELIIKIFIEILIYIQVQNLINNQK